MDGDVPPEAWALIAGIEAALLDRQALLLGPDAEEQWARERIDSLGAHLAALLERLAVLYPPDTPA
jgi:hypothetical protein